MQPICHAMSVLGSRLGFLFNPADRNISLLRFDSYKTLPVCELVAGAEINGERFVFPFAQSSEGKAFDLLDMRISPCSVRWIGLHGPTNTKVTLTAYIPFRPRDADFSTIPAVQFALEAEALPGAFRWVPKQKGPQSIKLFWQVRGEPLQLNALSGDTLSVQFQSKPYVQRHDGVALNEESMEGIVQQDRLLALGGQVEGEGFAAEVVLAVGKVTGMSVFWTTWSAPVMEVHGTRHAFRYNRRFADLDAVSAWVRNNPTAIRDNAAKVDGIIAANSCSKGVNNLLAQTLHSWLINTWWLDRDGKDWFSVWEGNCHFHSTVDVEFTQSPFYLAVWPELLGIELDFWPEFIKSGEILLGTAGKGTAFLSHDVGSSIFANGQAYHHEMEVEETTNYLILATAYWRRTGDDSLLRKHVAVLKQFTAFLRACDTTGTGVPDKGVSNTIDDASPAVQFGSEQVYLAVKTLAALVASIAVFKHLGDSEEVAVCERQAAQIRARVAESGWNGDHFNTLLVKGGKLTNPWTGKVLDLAEIPGWDSPHIYTANALAVLDMIGMDSGLDPDMLKQDLHTSTERCLREFGCVHTDFTNAMLEMTQTMEGLAGASSNPGWISMNMLRDIAAFYRGVDLRALTDRYWEWQTTTNSREPKVFFETFGGNNLCFYPRGIAIWGFFEALGGQVIDKVGGIDSARPKLGAVRVPRLFDADWVNGSARTIVN